VANIEGTLVVADSTDTTAGFKFDASDITTATVRTLKAPDADGTIALKSEVTGLVPTGSIVQGIWATAPAGYVLADGRTIGSATSGASSRANADCEALFGLLWTQFPAAPIYTFEGVVSTRGANAAADFAANKRLTMFDARGRAIAGLDNMGGGAAGVLPGWTTMGLVGGTPNDPAQGIAVSGSCSVSVTVGVTVGGGTSVSSGDTRGMQPGGDQADGPAHTHTFSGTGSGSGSGGGSISGSGSTAAVTNVQPTVVVNIAVKL